MSTRIGPVFSGKAMLGCRVDSCSFTCLLLLSCAAIVGAAIIEISFSELSVADFGLRRGKLFN